MIYRLIIGLVLTLLLSSCLDDWDEHEVEDTVVIQGYLVHGQEENFVRVNEITPIGEGEMIGVEDAEVKIEWRNRIFTFAHDNSKKGYYSYEREDFQVIIGDLYKLTVEVNGNVYYSETVVPEPPRNLRLSDVTLPLNVIESIADTVFVNGLQSVINMSWDPSGNHKYVARLDSRNIAGDTVVTSFADGNVDVSFISSLDGDIIDGDEINIWDFDIKRLGVNRVLLYTVNEEYEDIFQFEDAVVDQIFTSPSNIQNGVGLFTAVSVDSVFFVAVPTEE